MNVVDFPKLSNISRKKTEPQGREDTHTHAIAFLSKSTSFFFLILTHSHALELLLNFDEIDQSSKISGKITKNKLI